MPRRLLLDTGPLGKLAHPKLGHEALNRLQGALKAGLDPAVPDVCEFELRRELLRAGLTASLRRLDEIILDLGLVEVTPPIWRDAARLWAQARNAGRPTAHPQALDADVILAAEARAHRAAVLTTDRDDLAALLGPEHVITWQAL